MRTVIVSAPQVSALIEAAKAHRYGHRDATMPGRLPPGFRAAELCDLRWHQVEFDTAVLHVRRIKNGTPSTQPIKGDELRALRRLERESPPFVFVSERGSPSSPRRALPACWSGRPRRLVSN
jgi:integrase